MTDIKKLGSETAVVTHGKILAMIEALDKNNGDVDAAKKDFENSKEYGDAEIYSSPKTQQDGSETKEALPQANEVKGSQGAAAESVTAPSPNPDAQAYRDSAARL